VPSRLTPYPEWIHPHRRALGRRIRDLRTARGWSQERLASEIGAERRSVQRYETAAHTPTYADLLVLAHALDVTVAQLVDIDPGPEAGPIQDDAPRP
jgi:transcriptional regulator with XRE-family HTH domain